MVDNSPTKSFALALTRIEGVGKVTAERLLRNFRDLDDLRTYPREQVLLRIKGVGNAPKIVGDLFDDAVMTPMLAEARGEVDSLTEKGIKLLTPRDVHWPAGLSRLAPAHRPSLLYAYGDLDRLTDLRIALIGAPPLSEGPFDLAQDLLRSIIAEGLVPVTGVNNAVDVVMNRIASMNDRPRPTIMVASCGLARVAPPLRPLATASVRAGGLMLSSFPMNHVAQSHDEYERVLIQAAVAHASVFLVPSPGSHEASGCRWSSENQPLFILGGVGSDFTGAVPIMSSDDFPAAIMAARRVAGEALP
jgi:DNA processing protein